MSIILSWHLLSNIKYLQELNYSRLPHNITSIFSVNCLFDSIISPLDPNYDASPMTTIASHEIPFEILEEDTPPETLIQEELFHEEHLIMNLEIFAKPEYQSLQKLESIQDLQKKQPIDVKTHKEIIGLHQQLTEQQ